MKKSGLGKGLDALIPRREESAAPVNTGIMTLPIEKITPNKMQPRKVFNDSSIKELSESIKEKGIIQPLIVRKKGDLYEIVAGERRWRASQLAGIKNVPVTVSEVDETETLEVALVENLQREDISPIEEAEAYQQLINDHGLTHEDISKKIGKNRSTISNQLRLLRLSANAREALASGAISSGHARALVTLEDQTEIDEMLNIIIQKKLSVRQTESRVKSLKKLRSSVQSKDVSAEDDVFINTLTEELKRALGTKVSIKGKRGAGKIEIQYYSAGEFERLMELLTGK